MILAGADPKGDRGAPRGSLPQTFGADLFSITLRLGAILGGLEGSHRGGSISVEVLRGGSISVEVLRDVREPLILCCGVPGGLLLLIFL